MKKLTPAQIKALQTIADNPGNTVAWQRGPRVKTYAKINGNTEYSLSGAGLIKAVDTGRLLYSQADPYEPGVINSANIEVWELTDAGRDALGIKTEPKPEPKKARRVAKREQSGMDSLRDMLKLY